MTYITARLVISAGDLVLLAAVIRTVVTMEPYEELQTWAKVYALLALPVLLLVWFV